MHMGLKDKNYLLVLPTLLNSKNYYSELESGEVLFAYKGAISPALFDNVLHLIEKKISELEKPRVFHKKVHVIVVEILQNIFHHLALEKHPNPTKTDTILFILGKDEEGYFIIAGNFVLNEEVEELRKKIDWVNSMDTIELKQNYRALLSNGEFSEKGGAGLGFIDIARKSGRKLDYIMKTEGNLYQDCSFFTLKVVIPA